jgi:hypothetical protein
MSSRQHDWIIAGLALLASITGCAHLGKSPPQASTAGSASRPAETADARASLPADSGSVTKPRSSSGGTAAGTHTPAPVNGGSVTDKGQPRAAAPQTLALSEIEQRLRDTHAIGVFTKLSLKNQIDDLLGQLRAYRLKQTSASLPQLRQRYDVLLQKVIGLLRSGDAPLAKDISSSREAIWSLLIDPTLSSQL